MKRFLIALILVLLPTYAIGSILIHNCTSFTGGSVRALDAQTHAEGYRAIVMVDGERTWFLFDTTDNSAEQTTTPPRIVRPDDWASDGVWIEQVVDFVLLKNNIGMQSYDTGGTARTILYLDNSGDDFHIDAPAAAGRIQINQNSTLKLLIADDVITVNNAATDVNTQVRGDTDSNLIFVDAGLEFVGIGTGTPSSKLNIKGKVTVDDSASISPLNVTERASEPTSPASGDIYLDDGSNTASAVPGWRRYTGAGWEDISAAAGGAHKDTHDPQDGADPLDSANAAEISVVVAAGTGVSHSFARADHIHAINHAITNNHLATIDDAGAADNEYAKFTADGLEGRTYANVRTDINVEDAADVTDATNVAAAGAIMATSLNAKGDLITATADDTPAILTVGADTFVLTANSAIGSGLEWVAAGAPGAHKDTHDPNDGADPLDTAVAAEISIVVAAGAGASHSFAAADHIHAINHAITDNHIVTIDGDPNNGEATVWTANGLAGMTEGEFKTAFNMEAGTDYLAEQTIGIADNNLMEVDDADAANTDYARFTANGLQGRDATEAKTDLGLVIGTNVLAEQTIGIADDNLVEVDGDPNAAEVAIWTANGIAGQTEAEFKAAFNMVADTDYLANVVADTTPQLGGNLDLNQNSIVLDPTPTADNSWQGLIMTLTAGEELTIGEVAYLNADGKFYLADADAEATTDGMLVIVTATIALDASGVVMLQGVFRDDGWAYTAGDTLYVHTTGGVPTATAPAGAGDQVRIVGYALSDDEIYFNPDGAYVEVPAP